MDVLEVLEVDILWPRWVARIGVTRSTQRVCVCESAIATAMSVRCQLVLSPRWRRGLVPRLPALLWAPAAARRGGCEQWDRSGFIPACSRCRFFGEILLNLFVDKAVPELLLLDCAAEPAPQGRDVRRRHRGYNAGPSPGCRGKPQNWRLSLLGGVKRGSDKLRMSFFCRACQER